MNELAELLKYAPFLATILPVNPQVAAMIGDITTLAQRELEFRSQESGKTTDEILAEARTEWSNAVQGADDLLNLGHENKQL